MRVECRVLGIRYLDFKDDKGEQIKGHQVFVSGVTDQPGWTKGVEVMKCWVPVGSNMEASVMSLIPGDVVYVEFNRRGKPVIVEVA